MMVESLVNHVLDNSDNLCPDQQVALFTLQNDYICIAGGFSHGELILSGKHLDLKGTPLEEVIKTKQAKTFPGIFMDALPFPSYQATDSSFECLCLPLLAEKGRVLGVAVLSQARGNDPPDYRMQMLSILRFLIVAITENARLFHLAIVDSLTGLYMRRYFEIRLQEEIARIRRHKGVISLLLVDIDHFKKINDTYGHQQGDIVLQEFGQLLFKSVRRDIDLPCRYGGEEFVVLLPNTDEEGAYHVGERIRYNCEHHPFTTTTHELLRVTVSIGIASMEHDSPISEEELIQHADLMLYAAKGSGRNIVMKYSDDK